MSGHQHVKKRRGGLSATRKSFLQRKRKATEEENRFSLGDAQKTGNKSYRKKG